MLLTFEKGNFYLRVVDIEKNLNTSAKKIAILSSRRPPKRGNQSTKNQVSRDNPTGNFQMLLEKYLEAYPKIPKFCVQQCSKKGKLPYDFFSVEGIPYRKFFEKISRIISEATQKYQISSSKSTPKRVNYPIKNQVSRVYPPGKIS